MMRKCPYCGGEIQEEAVKCKHCKRWLGLLSEKGLTEKRESTAGFTDYTKGPNMPTNGVKTGPTGVGGWLMLLVIGMMCLGPLLGAGRMYSDFKVVEDQYPNIISLADWKIYKSITWVTFLTFSSMSFYGGLGFLTGRRDYSAVTIAKAILWITGPVASIVLAIIIPAIIFGEVGASDPKFVGGLIASVISASIWTAYLSRSKRVRNTYGDPKHSK